MRISKNWFVHNMLGHPVSEICFWIVRPFVGLERAEMISMTVHDATVPTKSVEQEEGSPLIKTAFRDES